MHPTSMEDSCPVPTRYNTTRISCKNLGLLQLQFQMFFARGSCGNQDQHSELNKNFLKRLLKNFILESEYMAPLLIWGALTEQPQTLEPMQQISFSLGRKDCLINPHIFTGRLKCKVSQTTGERKVIQREVSAHLICRIISAELFKTSAASQN